LQEKLRLADKLGMIGQLAAGTAHELNEPIAAILGFAELAQTTAGLPAQADKDLGKIAKAALHARDIIKQLLLFARQTPLRREPIDLNQIVADALEVLEPRCERSRVGVVRELSPELPRLEGDPHGLRQVVVNLVANAVQASSPGSKVRVLTSSTDSGVLLAVVDHGCGMTEEVRKNLFLPFYTTKEVGQGSGLGLSVVHGIVTAHGGTIQVDSAPDRGTRIEVRLPLGAKALAPS
jgi:signal transduction histidine kinase